jgi:endonuclease-3
MKKPVIKAANIKKGKGKPKAAPKKTGEEIPGSGSLEQEKKRCSEVYELLLKQYPDAHCALEHKDPLQLLVATILSAQCTDERVNIVTKDLFKKYKTAKDYLLVPDEELEKDIYSTGFFRQKAKSIKNCCRAIIDQYGGKVPADFDKLTELPGVGRKTASVVAGNAFNIPAFPVDTHVKRLTNLLGFVKSENPDIIEIEIKKLLPEDKWVMFSHLLIFHGRKVCIARRPKCLECVLGNICPGFNPKLD